MNSTIYLKGDPGFKSAVLTKLGGTWIHGIDDSDKDVLGFSMPENIRLEEFKKTIGNNNIVAYHLTFLEEPSDETEHEAPMKFTPGGLIKMSIWSNENYDLTRK